MSDDMTAKDRRAIVFMVALAFILLMACLVGGLYLRHDREITHRHRADVCRTIDTESLKVFCVERS